VTGLKQVVSSLVLRIGMVLFLALCIVELIALSQVRVCVYAHALIHIKNDMKNRKIGKEMSKERQVLFLQILYCAIHVECCAPW
jgi:hypothetical protein